MGLDMYLKKKIYVGANYDHRKITGKITIKQDGRPINVNFKRVSEITENVGYWRKANHIHKWFVENCQDGEDDCREAFVSREQLKELLETCKKVMKTNPTKITKITKKSKKVNVTVKGETDETAEDLLPTQSGFFFGGTEIGEYYYDTIEDTIKIIEDLLKELNDDDSVYYQSSW
jgi:hypothetical protein